MVRVRLSAATPEMVACAQDALGLLIDELSKSLNVSAMELNSGEEVPREVATLFQQLADDTDAFIEVAGSRIVITGTSDGTAQCQQKIAAFVQQVRCCCCVRSLRVPRKRRRFRKCCALVAIGICEILQWRRGGLKGRIREFSKGRRAGESGYGSPQNIKQKMYSF